MSDDRSRELLAAWRRGDADAGDRLLQLHFASLCRLFAARVPGRAADLIQATMLAVVESRERVPEGLPFRAYLLGIARRVLVGAYREHDREQRRAFALAQFEAHSRTSPSEAASRREQQRWLLAALRELPLDLQLPLELHYWEDLALPEVAAVLELPLGTVKSRLRRAKEALVEAMQARPGELEAITVDDLARWASQLRWHLARSEAG
ncbi:MAG: sigma-70 family RNA polymerase sigma factor [Nannocystaceae bacterium]